MTLKKKAKKIQLLFEDQKSDVGFSDNMEKFHFKGVYAGPLIGGDVVKSRKALKRSAEFGAKMTLARRKLATKFYNEKNEDLVGMIQSSADRFVIVNELKSVNRYYGKRLVAGEVSIEIDSKSFLDYAYATHPESRPKVKVVVYLLPSESDMLNRFKIDNKIFSNVLIESLASGLTEKGFDAIDFNTALQSISKEQNDIILNEEKELFERYFENENIQELLDETSELYQNQFFTIKALSEFVVEIRIHSLAAQSKLLTINLTITAKDISSPEKQEIIYSKPIILEVPIGDEELSLPVPPNKSDFEFENQAEEKIDPEDEAEKKNQKKTKEEYANELKKYNDEFARRRDLLTSLIFEGVGSANVEFDNFSKKLAAKIETNKQLENRFKIYSIYFLGNSEKKIDFTQIVLEEWRKEKIIFSYRESVISDSSVKHYMLSTNLTSHNARSELRKHLERNFKGKYHLHVSESLGYGVIYFK